MKRSEIRVPAAIAVLDYISAFAIIGIVAGLLAGSMSVAIRKTQLTEVLYLFRAPQLEMVEKIATQGSLGDAEVQPADSEEEPDYEQSLNEARAMKQPITIPLIASVLSKLSSDATGSGAVVEGSRHTKYQFSTEGLTITATRLESLQGQPLHLTFTPAAYSDGLPWNVIWLCGKRRSPAGWVSDESPNRTNVPEGLLYSVCRERGSVD